MRDVRDGGEDPERREPERGDRPELDHVARALSHRQASGVGLELVLHLDARVDSADQLDRDAEEVLRRRLVETRAAHDPGQGQLERLVEHAAERRGDYTHRSLWQGDEEGSASHGR